ncbi:MAG: hypothetical protein AAF596_07035 [Planctomycetota bacterium]
MPLPVDRDDPSATDAAWVESNDAGDEFFGELFEEPSLAITEPADIGYHRYLRIMGGGFGREEEQRYDDVNDPVAGLGAYDETTTERLWFASYEFVRRYPLGGGSWRFQPEVPSTVYSLYGAGLAVEYAAPWAATERPAQDYRLPPGAGWFFGGWERVDYFTCGLKLSTLNDEFDDSADLRGIDLELDIDSEVFHSAIGPVVSYGRVWSRGRDVNDLSCQLMLGYQRASFDQRNRVVDTGAFPNPTLNTFYEDEANDFAVQFEIRYLRSYLINDSWSFDLLARLSLVGPYYESSQQIDFSTPAFGLTEPDSDVLFGASIYAGVTYSR